MYASRFEGTVDIAKVKILLIFNVSDENGEDYKLARLRWSGHVQMSDSG